MKVTLTSEEDVKCVNWMAIADQIADHARKRIAAVMTQAGNQLKELRPGENRKFVIEIGTIEISREANDEHTDGGQGPIPLKPSRSDEAQKIGA